MCSPMLCRERKLQLRSLLHKKRKILLHSWSNPGDQACGNAIQLAICMLNDVLRFALPQIVLKVSIPIGQESKCSYLYNIQPLSVEARRIKSSVVIA